jgi:hypothetical protein
VEGLVIAVPASVTSGALALWRVIRNQELADKQLD